MTTYRRILATLCYALNDGQVLLLHRNKEPNKGLWVAPGGKMRFDESPEECAVRELWEETGLRARALELEFRGLITEISPRADYQWLIFIFLTRQFSGVLTDCPEGKLAWVPIQEVTELPIPGSDAIFFPHIIGGGPAFRAKFTYDEELGITDWEQYA
ncbi:MAG: NUDIX domain-containing protein [Ardenticatenales bacterium]|nr:NUDIX domain-containing protein [Ardenticatenales bacterium]